MRNIKKIIIKNIFRIVIMPVILYCSCLTVRAADGYLVGYSDSRYLQEQDVKDFSVQELCYAKNEIFARHGRLFQSVELTQYFNAQSWYSGYIAPEAFDSSLLNEVEWANAEFLRSMEYSRQANGYQLDQPGYDISAVRTMRNRNTGGTASTVVSREKLSSMLSGNVEYLGTAFRLDLNRDGKDENISFLPYGPQEFYNDMEYCRGCTIRVDDQLTDQQGYTVHGGFYGVSLDGDHIWLIVADDGPSDDPTCTFYGYENGKLHNAGMLCDWIDHISVTVDGRIYGRTGCRVWDTALIVVCWQLGNDGMISMIPQEYYQMEHYSEDYNLTLLAPITVYAERSKRSTPLVLQPQKIEAPYTDAEKWVYLAAEDGTGGWFCTDDMDYDERMKVFQGLFMAD